LCGHGGVRDRKRGGGDRPTTARRGRFDRIGLTRFSSVSEGIHLRTVLVDTCRAPVGDGDVLRVHLTSDLRPAHWGAWTAAILFSEGAVDFRVDKERFSQCELEIPFGIGRALIITAARYYMLVLDRANPWVVECFPFEVSHVRMGQRRDDPFAGFIANVARTSPYTLVHVASTPITTVLFKNWLYERGPAMCDATELIDSSVRAARVSNHPNWRARCVVSALGTVLEEMASDSAKGVKRTERDVYDAIWTQLASAVVLFVPDIDKPAYRTGAEREAVTVIRESPECPGAVVQLCRVLWPQL